MNMDWKSLRKVWLDDNAIDSLEGVNSLARLSYLSIANNLLGEQAAQQMAQIRFTDLKYLKVSCNLFVKYSHLSKQLEIMAIIPFKRFEEHALTLETYHRYSIS